MHFAFKCTYVETSPMVGELLTSAVESVNWIHVVCYMHCSVLWVNRFYFLFLLGY